MREINKNECNTPIIIVKNNNTLIDILIEDYMLSIAKKLELINKDVIINKIKTKKYNDVIYLKGKEIKKDQLKEIYIQYSTLGIEGYNLKFLFIDNIEECSLNILNSLLKFIEEPPIGVWILFFSNNIYKVLPTIKSRCIVQQQENTQIKIALSEAWVRYSLNIINAFSTQKEIQEFLETNESSQIMNFINLYENYFPKDFFVMLDIFKNLDYSYILILLKILYPFNNNKNIFELINNINLNPNKTLMFYRLLEGKI